MTSTAIITGASAGIGRATALLLGHKGYNLVLAARQLEKLEAVAHHLQMQGSQAIAFPTDVTDEKQVNNLVEMALDTYSQVDVLINNAGICMTAPMTQTSLEDWHSMLNVNLWGYIYPIYALLPHFLSRQQGTIVNVGSFGGKMPLPNMTAYCTSKYAVTGLTQTLRLELEPKGIHVCGVHPSVTNSDFLERAVFRGQDDHSTQQIRDSMGKILNTPFASQPQDVAKAIAHVLEHPQGEIVVGTGALATNLYRFAPSLTQWLLQQSISS